jgi:hypothetical protein
MSKAVMAGLAPAIHVLFAERKAWMPGTRPGMTKMLDFISPVDTGV